MGIILRQNKGSELTFAEVDGNFQSLYYSSSLSGTDLQFFFASSSVTHSIDLTNVPGFTGITVQSGSTTIDTGVQTLNFLGSGVASIIQSGTDGVDITIEGGGGSGTGIFQQSASSDVYFATSSLLVSGSTIQESPWTTIGANITASYDGTGGGVPKYALSVSQSVWHYTDNVGVPTSKAWKTDLEGSVFNRYDHNTDTAEILRFMAGLLSASAPDATPNERVWNSTNIDFSVGGTTSKSSYMTGVLGGSITYRNARLSQEWTSSLSINMALTQSYRDVQEYLIGKGFLLSSETGSGDVHDVGTHPFGISTYGSNIPSTIYNNFSSFTFNADSVAGGSTIFSSSIGAQAFGMGELINSTTVRPYSASVFLTQSFSDNSTDTTPDQTSTFTTNSISTYIINTEDLNGDGNGLYLGIIPTNDPQIDDTFQDGKFLNSPAGYTGRKWNNTDGDGTTGATTSSIGYYRFHGINYGLKTGSQSSFSYQTPGDTTNGFYMPSLGTLGVVNITQKDPSTQISKNLARTSFSAASRSLSGAPYISASAYTFDYDTSVRQNFDPCYGYSTTPIATSNPTDQWETIGSTTLTPTSVTVNTNGIQTSNASAGVFPVGSNPAGRRSTNAIPAIRDVSFLSSSFSFTLDANYNNVTLLSSSQHNINYDVTFRTTGRNWKNSSTTDDTTATEFYDATLFGQEPNSGSMAIYGRAQGYDAGSLTTFSEGFSGETYRIKITDNFLSGSYADGDKFITSSYDIGLLSTLDLQVKPGYLVTPGGDYGYWLPSVPSANTYQYYARAFQRNLATGASNMTASFGTTLNAWESTSDGVSAAIIFKSSNIDAYSTPRIYDPTQTTSNVIDANIANDNFKNPFSDNIALYGNSGGSINGNNYNIPLRGIDGMVLDGTDQDFIVIIRYKGDPTPVEDITITIA
jgi:hypothetical protein